MKYNNQNDSRIDSLFVSMKFNNQKELWDRKGSLSSIFWRVAHRGRRKKEAKEEEKKERGGEEKRSLSLQN